MRLLIDEEDGEVELARGIDEDLRAREELLNALVEGGTDLKAELAVGDMELVLLMTKMRRQDKKKGEKEPSRRERSQQPSWPRGGACRPPSWRGRRCAQRSWACCRPAVRYRDHWGKGLDKREE